MIRYSSILIFSFFTFILLLTKVNHAQKISTISLNDHWHFMPAAALLVPPKKDDLGQNIQSAGYATQLPNTALNALFENGAIEDPFYGINEKRLQWLEKKDWIFEKTFDVDPSVLNNEKIDLILRGLDTYAEVSVNDVFVLKADNMFRTWQADIKKALKPQGNVLKIYFTSPVAIEKKKAADAPVDYPDVYNTTRAYTRKAQFHYGWDWGPRLLTCGLESAELIVWNQAKIENVFIKQGKLTADSVKLQAQVTVNATQKAEGNFEITINGKTFTQKAALTEGVNMVAIDAHILHPKLWWTHDLGTPFLYDVDISFQSKSLSNEIGEGNIENKQMRIGIRTIELMTEKDEKGGTFYFKLNGKPIFAKGANYIPQHYFQEKVKPQDNLQMINNAVEANMNMLRVWGGGIYETDHFYQTCDEKGLLIWQDFMYACAMYPGDKAFLENAKAEAIEQVQRLRNHPCIALWCGNNEINEAWHNWGWQPRFNPDQKEIIWSAYQALFNKILPDAVSQYANNTSYWESSPSFGRYNNKSYTEGDSHDWFVWHDEKPFEHFEQRVPRFMSEYGFQSFPDWATIESFTKPEERELTSEVMLLHQKHPKGNQLIKKYMAWDFRLPKTFKDFVYVSQILQAHGIGKAIEAQRRAKPYCMGTLYWQLNDVWQVASWSSIDNFGRWKALQYKAREVYANVLISPVVEKNYLRVHIVNDSVGFKSDLSIQSFDFTGKKIFDDTKTVEVKTDTSGEFYNVSFKELLKDSATAQNAYVVLTLKQGDTILSKRIAYLVPPKDLNLMKRDIFKEITPTKGGFLIKLKCSVLCKSVQLACNVTASGAWQPGWFNENYFDILPNQEKVIFYKTKAIFDDFVKGFEIKSLVDTY